MSLGSVPVRYARALLTLGEETQSLPALQREWAEIGATVEGAPALLPALANPQLAAERREAILAEVLDRVAASPATRKTCRLLLRKGRILVLGEVATAFQRMVDRKMGRGRAEVTTAVPMPEDFHRTVQSRLEASAKVKLTVDRKVDPEILGGVVARVGDLLYDGSLRTALERLRERLMAEQGG